MLESAIRLVTGATSGIGRATAQRLASMGQSVVVLGRDASALDAVSAKSRATTANDAVEVLHADLGSLSTRSATDGTIGNQVGTIVLLLPDWEADVQRRLDLIARTTRETKVGQRPAAIKGVLVGLSATPIGRYLTRHQRAANVHVTNVIGPPVPMFILGSRILERAPSPRSTDRFGDGTADLPTEVPTLGR